MKETELAQKFIDYLSCFDLYFEVDYYRCIDIVALNGNISTAIEVKTTFNFKVLEQAVENKKHFNFSYIACPEFKDWTFQKRLCADYGIGLLMYDPTGYKYVNEYVKPQLNRHANNQHEFNKTSLAGSRSGDGGKITAFQVTKENAIMYVRRHQGCTIKQMIDNISHHYQSNKLACTNMYQWIYQGVIKEIEYRNRKLYIKN
jgi:hypothetical protein